MPPIKSLDRISAKWIRQSAVSEASYLEGVTNPTKDWEKETLGAESNFEAGIQKAITAKTFGKGVKRAGTDKWQRNAMSKGPGRWREGIALSENAYSEGFAPYAEVIRNLTLPARGPKGDPKNIARVAAIAKALHDKKVQLQGQA